MMVFSPETEFMRKNVEDLLQNNDDIIDIENFSKIISSVFEERENILKNSNKQVIENFKAIMTIYGFTASTVESTVNKLQNGKKPFKREQAIMYCFAAGYNTEEADIQLQKIFLVDGLHLRYYEDLIYAFFLRKNTVETCQDNFRQATDMINQFKPMYEKAETLTPIDASDLNFLSYTEFFEEKSEEINSIEQLKNFLKSEDTMKKAGKINRTAKTYMYDALIELCVKIIDGMRITQSSNELDELFAQQPNSQKLFESLIELLNDIFDPYSHFLIPTVDISTRPEYFEIYSGSTAYQSWSKEVQRAKQLYASNRYLRTLSDIWNSNYSNMDSAFSVAVNEGRFQNLIDHMIQKNKESTKKVTKKLIEGNYNLNDTYEKQLEMLVDYIVERNHAAKEAVKEQLKNAFKNELKQFDELADYFVQTNNISKTDAEIRIKTMAKVFEELDEKQLEKIVSGFVKKYNSLNCDMIIKQLREVYFHSMFNAMIYCGKWGLGELLKMPRDSKVANIVEHSDGKSSVNPHLRGWNQIDESTFYFSQELSDYIVDYMTAFSENGEPENVIKDGICYVRPFSMHIKSVKDFVFAALLMLGNCDDEAEDQIDDKIEQLLNEGVQMPQECSEFSYSLASLIKGMDNNKSNSANTMLINNAPYVNRELLALALVIRELMDYEKKHDRKEILVNVNLILKDCGMAPLNPHNSLDMLLIGSLSTKSPISYIRSYLLYMLPNI